MTDDKPEAVDVERPLLCKLGLHRWVETNRDFTIFGGSSYSYKCARCPETKSEYYGPGSGADAIGMIGIIGVTLVALLFFFILSIVRQ